MGSTHVSFADTQYEPRKEDTEMLLKSLPKNITQSVGKSIKLAPESAQDAIKSEEKEKNFFVRLPKSIYNFVYSAFNGLGGILDELGTGDKAIEGSLKGKSDPLPITQHERKF